MADIFNEIDEELRADKAKQTWQRYGKFAIAGAALIVAGAAGFTFWQDSQRAAQLELAERYGEALTQGGRVDSAAAAAEALDRLARESGGGFGLLGRLQSAALLGESGSHDAAAEAYRAVAADGNVDALYRDLAAVLAVAQAMSGGGDPAALQAELDPHMGDEKPWRYTARQLAAGLALARGDMTAAKEYLTQISDDPNAPLGARGTASELLRALGG